MDTTSSQPTEKTTESFQTEVNELLHLIIHSLYSHPEIFLRELISNASDALDKLKIEALTKSDLMPSGYEPLIRITADKEARTLTVSDNGIGMTAAEIRENLGKIAHSGTKAFVKAAEQKPELIGQFGVGFYSAFIVADKVTVLTQRAGSQEGVRWESDGKGSYSIEPCAREDGTGTTVTVHLKPLDAAEEGLQDFSEEWVVRSTVKKHSDFISYPIKMKVSRTDAEKNETTVEDVVLNSQKALWMKSTSEIAATEYAEFYQHLTHDYNQPLKTIHYKAEGTSEFNTLLFIPGSRPWNFDQEGSERGLSLYVKRVLVMNDCEDLLPAYLRFIRGVVDSSDLSLNVSREILQQDRQIVQIRRALTSKILKSLADMLKDERENYEKFWTSFGPTLKEGIAREPEKKESLLPLFLFHSTASTKLSSLAEYVGRMRPGQNEIYYFTGQSLDILRNSPMLERLKQKEFEVLLLDHPVDEFIAPKLSSFQEHKFKSISAPDLNLESEEEKKDLEEKLKQKREKLGSLIEVVKETLSEHIQDVQLSSRLTESPVCLVQEGQNAHFMEQMYRQMGKEPPKQKRIMEINPDHQIFERMNLLPKADQRDWSELLYCQALISEGSPLQDPALFVKKMTKLMVSAG
jgi:molecular chaperone HtpG